MRLTVIAFLVFCIWITTLAISFKVAAIQVDIAQCAAKESA